MPERPDLRQHSSLIISDPERAGTEHSVIKSTRKWPAGRIDDWTLPVLKKLAKHYPAAVRRIGEIIEDGNHKDNFMACKLVIETLVRPDSQIAKKALEGGNIKITVELAQEPAWKPIDIPASEVKEIPAEAESVQ